MMKNKNDNIPKKIQPPRLIKMNNKIILSIALFLLLSCGKTTDDDLEKTTLHYTELPKPVKRAFFYDEYYDHLMELNTPKRYEYISKQNIIMQWVYTGYISKKGDFRKYEIDPNNKYGVPYIVYGDSLYVPNQWNIVPQDSLNYTFTRFILE